MVLEDSLIMSKLFSCSKHFFSLVFQQMRLSVLIRFVSIGISLSALGIETLLTASARQAEEAGGTVIDVW